MADSDPAPGGEVVEAGGGVADLDPAAGGEAEAGVADRLGTTKRFSHLDLPCRSICVYNIAVHNSYL